MTARHRWPLLRILFVAHGSFVALLWVGFVLAVAVIVGIVAVSKGITASAWHHAAIQVPRWLLFGLGIDAVSTYLRMQLAHGRTRREFAGQVVAYSVALSGLGAVLITLGYLVERGVYALLDWPQVLSRPSLFTSTGDYPAIFGSYWLFFLMWTVAGVVIGLGFFRSQELGVLTIPLGIVIVLPSVLAMREGGLPLIGEILNNPDITSGMLVAASGGLFLGAVGLIWAMVRDVPMKAQPA